MNILSEQQAKARQLALPADGLLTDVSGEFIAELQASGAFVEYNQQVILQAGQPVDYVFCLISGQAEVSRPKDDYGKTHVATLGPGQWYGDTSIFLRAPSEENVYAEGEVIVWTIPPDTLRRLFFTTPGGTQLLYNFAISLAQKFAIRARLSAPGVLTR